MKRQEETIGRNHESRIRRTGMTVRKRESSVDNSPRPRVGRRFIHGSLSLILSTVSLSNTGCLAMLQQAAEEEERIERQKERVAHVCETACNKANRSCDAPLFSSDFSNCLDDCSEEVKEVFDLTSAEGCEESTAGFLDCVFALTCEDTRVAFDEIDDEDFGSDVDCYSQKKRFYKNC